MKVRVEFVVPETAGLYVIVDGETYCRAMESLRRQQDPVVMLQQAHLDINRNADWWAEDHSVEQALRWSYGPTSFSSHDSTRDDNDYCQETIGN